MTNHLAEVRQISGGQIKILKGAPIIEEVSSARGAGLKTPPPHAPTQIQYKRTFAQTDDTANDTKTL